MAPAPSTRLRAIHLVLLVLTLTIFAGAVGVFTLESRRFLGAVCAAALLALSLSGGWPGWRWWLAVAAFFILLWCGRQPELWMLLTVGMIYLGPRLATDEEFETLSACHAAAASVFSALFLFSRQWPAAWVTLERVARQTSEWVGRVSGSGISWGATAGGWWILLAFLALGSVHIAYSKARADRWRAWMFCGYAAALFLSYLGWGETLALWAVRVAGDQFTRYPGSSHWFSNRAMVGLHAPLILLAGELAVAVWLLPKTRLEVPPRPASRWRLGLVTGSALALGALAAFSSPLAPAKGSRVLYYGNGMLDWRVPIHGLIGIGQAGMFGLLPRYLEASGFQGKHLARAEHVDAKALGTTDVFVVINPTRYFSEAELRDTWTFVRNGGGLLVLGDHTDLFGIMGPLNQLLAPVPIRFRFDSAFSIRHWVGDYEWFDHPTTRRLDSSNDLLQQGTGASLALGVGAFPLVVGKFAFSDAGDRENKLNAYLGDYRYETGELLSDVVFLAGARHGAGRVVVFGDTTAFQNTAICRSGSFVSDVFTYLSNPTPHAWFLAVQRYLLVGAGMTVLAGCFWGRTFGQTGLACWALAVGMLIGSRSGRNFEPIPFQKGRFAFIDTMHANQFSLELWLPDSIGGLTTNLGRDGLLALMLRDSPMDQIRKGKVLVCIAPAKPYSPREVRAVQEFMRAGGVVIVSAGYEQREGARPLLTLAGCDIDSVPLGPVPIYEKIQDQALVQQIMQQPHMMDAWPILAPRGLDKIYYRSGESDIIGFKQIGLGGMLVIADAKFFWDKTLEQETTGWPGNIKLLRQILGELPLGHKPG